MKNIKSPRHGLARILSKSGLCSRSEAERRIRDGRVLVDGQVMRDPDYPVSNEQHAIEVDGQALAPATRFYLVLNKPRGLVTTTVDEQGRDTVYRCFDGSGLPWIAPVGRLDRASEGLLLFCNDPVWAAAILEPAAKLDKTYHVQIDRIPDPGLTARLVAGIETDGQRLSAKSAALLRAGEKHAWLEIVLDEGRNRQIRRMLAAFDIGVLRLVRIAIGSLVLGDLVKGQWRELTSDEREGLTSNAPDSCAGKKPMRPR